MNLSITQTTSKDFLKSVKEALLLGQEYRDNISVYDLEQYETYTCFHVFDYITGRVLGGFAINGNELVSVFSLKSGVGSFMRQEWLKMPFKMTLDCFEHLVPFYEKAGFEVLEMLENYDGAHLPSVAIMSQ